MALPGNILNCFAASSRLGMLFVMGAVLFAPNFLKAASESDGPATPRQLYNEGTKKLRDGKLQDAETSLQAALATQNEKVQPSALYNLGEVRFKQGAESLKKGPNNGAVHDDSQRASDNGANAIHAVDEALLSEDAQRMVSAYLRGRGSRRELKDAIAAVKHAMETYASVLTKWQRASGDFKSTAELLPSDADAKTNADLVDRSIARLVDQQQMMMQMMQAMSQQRSDLGKKMSKLKRMIPEDEGGKIPGKGEDDDEDEDKPPPKEPKAGDFEPEHQNGKEVQLTTEEAAHLLDMLKLDSNRKLSLGGTNETGKPKDRKGRDW